jgi:DNA-binding NarL/FixJ family response regulator
MPPIAAPLMKTMSMTDQSVGVGIADSDKVDWVRPWHRGSLRTGTAVQLPVERVDDASRADPEAVLAAMIGRAKDTSGPEAPLPASQLVSMRTGKGRGDDARPPSLLVIDSRSLTRDCLAAALHGAGIERVIAVANIEQAMPHIDTGVLFKAVFINLAADDFSQESLMAITEPLRTHLPESPLLLLSERMDAKHAAVAVRHGVHGFLSRDMALELTIAAIHFVELGWTLFPSELFPALSTQGLMAAPDPNLTWHLTGRQMEVLHHLRTGMANKNIGRLLEISERTVKAHVKEIMRRFGVSNRTQIVALLGQELSRPDPMSP